MRVKIPQRVKLALPVALRQPGVRLSGLNSAGGFGGCRKHQIFLWRRELQKCHGAPLVARLLHHLQSRKLLRLPIAGICPAALQDHKQL